MDHTFNMSSSVVDPMAKRQSQLGQKSGQDQTLAISELEGHFPWFRGHPLSNENEFSNTKDLSNEIL